MKALFRCLWCEEMVAQGDLRHSLVPGTHYACAVRAVAGSVGHQQGKCGCYVKDGTAEDDPPQLSKRQAARLAADLFNNQPGRN